MMSTPQLIQSIFIFNIIMGIAWIFYFNSIHRDNYNSTQNFINDKQRCMVYGMVGYTLTLGMWSTVIQCGLFRN